MNRSRITGDLVSQNNIFVDIANDRVGIGSTIPGEKLSLPDSAKIALGNNADLQLYHDTSLSQIVSKDINNFTIRQQAGSGFLFIHADQLHLRSQSTNEPYFVGTNNGTVQLYYDNSVKFNTAAIGIVVTGTTDTDGLVVSGVTTATGNINIVTDNKKLQIGAGQDLQLYHTGTNTYISNSTGTLFTLTDTFEVKGSNGNETHLKTTDNGAVELYHNNVKKFETTADGASISNIPNNRGLDLNGAGNNTGIRFMSTGSSPAHSYRVNFHSPTGTLFNSPCLSFDKTDTSGNFSGHIAGISDDGFHLADNKKLHLGSSGSAGDLQIYHNGSHSFIDDIGTGNLKLRSNNFRVSNADESKMSATFQPAGAVELYHNNTKRLETFDNSPFVGISVVHDVVLNSSGDSAYRWAVGGNASSNFKWSMFYSNSSSSLNIFDNVNSRTVASFKETGAIELNYQASKKFETTSGGINVTGNITGTGQLTLTGTGMHIENATTPFIHLKDTTNNTDSYISTNDEGSLFLKADDNQEGSNTRIVFQIDGSEEASFLSGGNLDLHGGGSIIINDNQKLYFEGDNDDDFNCIGRQTSENSIVLTSRHDLANIIDSNNDDTDSYWSVRHNGTTVNSSSELMRVQSNGRVGMGGANSPEELLDLGNDLQINLKVGGRGYLGQAYSTAATILGHSVKAKTTGTVSGGMEVTETNSGGGAPAAIRMQSGRFEFHTASSGTSGATFDSERLRIKADGTIKIGGTAGFSETSIPLQVHNPSGNGSQMQFTDNSTGATSLSRGFRVGYNGSGGQLWNFENTYVRFATNNTERIRITSAGDVGIGYDSPTVKLHIREAASGASSFDNRYHIIVEDDAEAYLGFYVPNSGYAGIRFSDTTGLEGYIDYYLNNDQMHFYSSGTHHFETSGTERLQIRANGSMIAQTGSLGTTPLMELYNTDGSASTGTVLKLRTGRGQSTKDMPVFHITDGNSSQQTIFEVENSGRVGIMRDSPAYLLDIQNNTSAEGIRLRSTGSTYHDFYFDAARSGANQHIGRIIAKWSGNNTSMISMNTGSDTTNKDNGYISFCASEAGTTLTERFRCQGSVAGLVMYNGSYIEIPHDERCIVFDEGQKMITSNDGQGNFNIIGGKNHDAVHVSSTSGNSGIAQIEINSDGANGNINFAVGPTRSAGSTANFEKGFQIVYHSNTSDDRLNGLRYTTGSSTSPGGLATQYPVIHKGNAADGTWARVAGDGFKVLGDGGSIAITTNDGYGNCNVCWNHKDGVPDTAGSSWRIRCDIDAGSSDMHFQTAASASSGSAVSVGSRMVLASNGNLQIDGSLSTSDQRLKKNIKTITNATTIIKGLTGKTFEWKDELELATGTKYGFIAQEVESVVPDLVDRNTGKGFDKDGNILYDSYHNKDDIVEYSKAVNDAGVIPILVESLKESIAKIETLEAKVAALEGS